MIGFQVTVEQEDRSITFHCDEYHYDSNIGRFTAIKDGEVLISLRTVTGVRSPLDGIIQWCKDMGLIQEEGE